MKLHYLNDKSQRIPVHPRHKYLLQTGRLQTAKFLFLVLVVSLFISASAPAQEVQQGNLYTLISQIKNAMPGLNSYGFVPPSPAQQDSFGLIIDSILAEKYQAADSLAGLSGYKLLEWYDTAFQNRRYYILMETNGNQIGGVVNGWGTYIFYPEGNKRLIIEAPHPLHDVNTWRVSFYLFQRLGCKFMLLAGTHRYANGQDPAPADVAHNTINMFHSVHQKVSPFGQFSYQVHGFSRDDYPDIVLSNGTATPYAVLDTLHSELTNESFSVGVFDGINYAAYGATLNVQGQWSRANGFLFIHMELQRFIRDSESQWQKVINAIERTFLILPTRLDENLDPVPGQAILLQNFPNPFNPKTNILFSLPGYDWIELNVYDISGKQVQNIFSGTLPPGFHLHTWNGRDNRQIEVTSGLYIITLQTSKFSLARKVQLLK